MRYQKTVTLKNGISCLLRNPEKEDAKAILEHMIQTSGETNHMSRYPDEITMTVEQEGQYLADLVQNPKAIMISAMVEGEIVANAGINMLSPHERLQHRAGFGISIKRSHWGMGIGSAILDAVIESAKAAHYEQLELDVVAENDRAISLYKKFGFQIFGTHEKAFRYRDGSYATVHLMVLNL